MAEWDDVPHITKEDADALLSSYSPHEREARSKGIPQLGSGAIYPVPESDIVVDPFTPPANWPRAFGMDVGWNRTAAIWGAVDPETGVVYLYNEYYRSQAEPVVHAAAIAARGEWIPGVVDPAARGRSQKDGLSLFDEYCELGLVLNTANNAVEAGLLEVWNRVSTGGLKVCSHLSNWLAEYRIYRRDEKGKVVKQNDHLMDATRYLIMSGINIADTNIHEDTDSYDEDYFLEQVNTYTGY